MSGLTDRLRQVAGQATYGPWKNDGGPWVKNAEHYVASGWRTNESVHIATFDPVLVERMLDAVEWLDAFAAAHDGHDVECDRCQAAEIVARIEELSV